MNRQAVYNKYSGRCAYCGREIGFKEMQVDHMVPKASGGTDEIENLMPACRLCNHYKRANSLEWFRHSIETIPIKLARDMYTYRVGMAYGFYSDEEKKIMFYFEQKQLEKLLGASLSIRQRAWKLIDAMAVSVMNGHSFKHGDLICEINDDYQMWFDHADLKAGYIQLVRVDKIGNVKPFKLIVDVIHLSILRVEWVKVNEPEG